MLALPVRITEKALMEIRKILAEKNIPAEYGLRIGSQGGGCSGVNHFVGFDLLKETDHQYELEGVRIFIEKKHLMFLIGAELDFLENAEERGFCFNS